MEKPKRPMTLEESSIFINVKKLRRLLWWATFNMMPCAKATMGRRMLSVCGEVLGNYTLAYLLREGKLEYLTQAVAHFAELRIDIEQALEDNIFHFPKRKTKNKNGTPEDEVSSRKIEILSLVAKIDGEMCGWLRSLSQGTIVRAERAAV